MKLHLLTYNIRNGLLSSLLFTLVATTAFAGSATVSWDENSESDLAGYNIYYATASQSSNAQIVNVGNGTSYTITGLQEGVTYFFRVTAYDFSGNESNFSDEVSINISGGNRPELITTQPMGPTQIDVIFSEPMERTSAENTANYFISNGVEVLAAILDDNETVAHLLTSPHEVGVNYTLSVSGVRDKQGNEILEGSSDNYSVTDSGSEQDSNPPALIYTVLTEANSLDVVFSEPVEALSGEDINNYAINNGIQVLGASIQSSASIVRLTTTEHSAGGSYELTVNNVRDRVGNPISSNSTMSYEYSAEGDTPPAIASVSVNGQTQIDVTFTEPLESSSARNTENYSISNGIEVRGAVLDDNPTIVHLLTTSHSDGQYTVTVNNVRDLTGTPIAANSTFDYSYSGSQSDGPTNPVTFSLFQNYPNPFNPETEIRFFLDENREVQLKVYNTLGQLVNRLVQDEMPSGFHTVVWNGKDARGVEMPSGVYIYSLEVKRNVQKDDLLVSVSVERRVKRMTLVR